MSNQKIYHRYSICQHGDCSKKSYRDVVGSSLAPFGRGVSLCKKHLKELGSLEFAHEEGIDKEYGFWWKESFIDTPLDKW